MKMTAWLLQSFVIWLVTLHILIANAANVVSDESVVMQTEQGGITLAFQYTPQGEGTGLTRLTFTDTASGRALDGFRPAAWIQARHSEQVANELSCDDKARHLMAGSLARQAEVDLNSYRLVTLNHDNTVAFINPHVGLMNSKLESIISLPATGYDWLHIPQTQRLFVSLRDANAVAVIDTVSRRLLTMISTGAGSLPTRLSVDVAYKRVWVGLDGGTEVLALDSTSGAELARVPVNHGVHVLHTAADASWLFVTNAQSNSVAVIDRSTLKNVADIKVDQTPIAAAWSSAAQRLAVLSINAGTLNLLDPDTRQISATVALARGVIELGLFDNGRYALVLNNLTDTVTLVDLSVARVMAEMQVSGKPDQIIFSKEFAYIRSQKSADIHVINLTQARTGTLHSVTIPMGRSTPADAPDAMNVASVMAAAPEGNGILMANPGDGSIYRYAEGKMVPVGSFSNYRRQARGLMVLDASLAERATGQFEAATRFERSGRYDVIVRNLSPAVTACFTLNAQGAAESAPVIASKSYPKLLSKQTSKTGELIVEFSLHDNAGKTVGVRDVTVLAMMQTGVWQQRTKAQYQESNRYTATIRDMPTGKFELLVQAPSIDLTFNQGRLGQLHWPLKVSSQFDSAHSREKINDAN